MSAPHHCPSPGNRSLPPLDLAPGTPLSARPCSLRQVDLRRDHDGRRLDLLRHPPPGPPTVSPPPGRRGTAENPPGTALDRRGDHFVDSTKIEGHVRADLVEQARPHDHPVVALRFLPDLSTCLARNAQRPPAGGYRRTPCAGSTALLGKPPRRPAPRGLHRRARWPRRRHRVRPPGLAAVTPAGVAAGTDSPRTRWLSRRLDDRQPRPRSRAPRTSAVPSCGIMRSRVLSRRSVRCRGNAR